MSRGTHLTQIEDWRVGAPADPWVDARGGQDHARRDSSVDESARWPVDSRARR